MCSLGLLTFVGLGLHDERGMSLRGLEELKKAEVVYAEFYTSPMPALSLGKLVALISKPVKILSRVDIEERAEETILRSAQTKRTALLVPGDPMVATTHIDLMLRARKAGIETSVVNGASIISAISSVTGLQNYKFGRTVTIPISHEGSAPESPYDYVKKNLSIGLHTLLLLEVGAESGRYVSVAEAFKQLLSVEARRKENVVTQKTLAVGAARIGAEDMKVKAGRVKDLMACDFGSPPHSIVIPSKLHFMEAEALQVLAEAERKVLEEHI